MFLRVLMQYVYIYIYLFIPWLVYTPFLESMLIADQNTRPICTAGPVSFPPKRAQVLLAAWTTMKRILPRELRDE